MPAIAYYLQLALEGVVSLFGVRWAEEPRYEVIDRPRPRVEVRHYSPRVAAEIDMRGGTPRDLDAAFSALFKYIAGANTTAAGDPARVAMTAPVETARPERIQMTAPVETRPPGAAQVMRFFLPRRIALADAPRPQDARIRIVEVPAEDLAVLRFRGAPDARDIEARMRELSAALQESDWRETAPMSVYAYDPPYALPFVRRNEIAVRVERR